MNEGTIKLVNARHPVLLLRGKAPVGNDMSLDGSMQALILTGPNAGRREERVRCTRQPLKQHGAKRAFFRNNCLFFCYFGIQ